MTFRTTAAWCFTTVTVTLAAASFAQQPPYDVFPPAKPPYYRVRYGGSAQPGELKFAVNYTIWIPGDVKTLRGVIVAPLGRAAAQAGPGAPHDQDVHLARCRAGGARDV